MNKSLLLRFGAPWQAWGNQSYYDRRTTLTNPTKSGVVGMISSAMGIKRDNTSMIATLASIKLTSVTTKIGRIETDYQTIGGGYPDDDKMHVPRTAEGNNRQAEVYKEYLADYEFGIVLEGPNDLIASCRDAFDDPVWWVYLGRKCCLPTPPFMLGMVDNRDQAKEFLEKQFRVNINKCPIIRDADPNESASDVLMDMPLDFSTRKFGSRRIRKDW